MRILVVDDDPLAGAMTRAVLEDGGHEVVSAENGIEACGVLDSDLAVALVVSDMNMPLMTGLELFQTLREQGMGIPFILLSGDDPGPLQALEPRLDGCLLKDAELDITLGEAIARLSPGQG